MLACVCARYCLTRLVVVLILMVLAGVLTVVVLAVVDPVLDVLVCLNAASDSLTAFL